MSEEIKETPTGELEQGEFKIKKKPKKLTKKDEPIKVDLSKKEETKTEDNAVQESTTNASNVSVEESKDETSSKGVVSEVREFDTKEEVHEPEVKQENPVIEEITEINVSEETVEESQEQITENSNIELPENIEKLVDFMNETGGNIEDYVRLNADYSNISEDALLNEYYKKTRPHLEPEEVKFLMEDKFSYDEDMDEERDIKRKKLAYKEEIAKAKNFLEETKKKYYDEIKLRPGVTQEQQKAMDFFNRYNKEQEVAKQKHEAFKTKTNQFFTNDFKGFDFNVGEKRFRYGVKNASEVADAQSDLTTFFKKFLNEDGSVKDQGAYHKAIYAARNADTIANHFYEQGKADATKDIMSKSKNISTDARTETPGDVFINGWKVKAVSGVDSSKLKVKTIRNKN